MLPKKPQLVDAIKSRLQVTFRYRSENSTQEESVDRVVEPWIYGLKNGKESLYGYQLGGEKPGLRRFDLRRVKTINLTGDYIENHPTDPADITKWDHIFAELSEIKSSAIHTPVNV